MSLTDEQFDAPLSNVEGLLQNVLGAENEVVPQSRVELILENALGGENEVEPQSRVEELLDRVVDKIKEGGYDLPAVIEPLSVTENGTYSAPSGVDGYSPITVDVPAVIEPLSVTENGTYSAPAGVDGYSPITVDVAGSGGDDADKIIMRTISEYTGNAGYIFSGAFQSFFTLQKVSFPNASYVGSSAFNACERLREAHFNTASEIMNTAFYGCSRLSSVSFPKLQRIGDYAFAKCSQMMSITLPSINYIGGSAFRSCILLVSVYLPVFSVPSLTASNAFNSTPIGGYSDVAGQFGSVYVPASLYESFLTATNWSLISSRIVSV